MPKTYAPDFRADSDTLMLINTLISNLVMTPEQVEAEMAKPERDRRMTRTHLQGKYALEPSMLIGDNWITHRLLLQLIENYAAIGIAPTKEALLQGVSNNVNSSEQSHDLKRRAEAILSHRTKYPDVQADSWNLRELIQKRKVIAKGEAAVMAASSPELDAQESYIAMAQTIADAAPADMGVRTVGNDFMAVHRKQQDERLRRLKSGEAIGVMFPWQGLREKVRSLKKGDLCTFMAKSGHGKTTIGLILAEYNAHLLPVGSTDGEDGHGFDVLYFHLETSVESMADRYISKRLEVQTGAMRMPEIFDHTVEPYKSKYDQVEAEWVRRNKNRGRLVFKGEPDMKPSVFKAECRAFCHEAEARGKEALIIVDYYTELDYTEFSVTDDTKGFAKLASMIKNTAQTLNCYMIAFSQYGVDTDYGSSKKGFGGQKINQRSQVVIRVEREDDAESESPIMRGSGKNADGQVVREHRRDLIGVPMYYHRKGEIDSRSVFRVIKANDDQLGPVPILFVNAYYKIGDHSGGRTSIPTKKKTKGEESIVF